MKRFVTSLLVLLTLIVVSTGCSMSRKNYSELRGLMLLENTQLGRNKEFYSKHNTKRISKAHQKYQKRGKYR